MSEAKARVVINIPREKAWEKLKDFSQAHNYVPGIIKTEITTSNKNGMGATRKVFQSESKSLEETIVEWNEGVGFKIKLHKGPKDAPFKNSYFEYVLGAGPNNTTTLVTKMGYTPPLSKVGNVLDRLILNRVISGVINDVALSMKLFYETGEPTTKKALKKIKSR